MNIEEITILWYNIVVLIRVIVHWENSKNSFLEYNHFLTKQLIALRTKIFRKIFLKLLLRNLLY